MTALGLVSDRRRETAPRSCYTIEYTSSEHRGIIMYSEMYEATSAAGALAYAKLQFSSMEAKYGARGYRVVDTDGYSHSSDGQSAEPR